MQIFVPVARGNAADTTSGCQMMSYTDAENNLIRNDYLNLNLSKAPH